MASPPGGPARGSAIRAFLIADIRGYTRFTAQHGDEAASHLATQFAEVALEGVEAWGGELVELRGDEALAVFDSPRQALRAALELGSAFADESAGDPSLPLGVGIGLDLGEAVAVGEGYRGAALNLAARLCAIAGSGEVLASEGLVRLAGPVDGLAYTALGPTTLKGYDEPIGAVRVAGSDGSLSTARVGLRPSGPEPPALPPELDPIVPLAGRGAELRWLAWHWRRASHGHGRTLVLSGLPGIGKTRLAAELATLAHDAGAMVVYRPAARLADDPSGALDVPPDRPVLTIVDDLDAAPADAVRSIVEEARHLPGRPAMLLVTHRLEAPPQLLAVAERLTAPEQRRALGPIDSEAVRTIVALYAGHATDVAPIADLLGESGGVPAAVHRVASRWARSTAAGRLEASADRTAVGRRGLRDAEAALIGDVADLELARERDRLFGVDAAEGDGVATGSRTVCPYKGLAEFEAADADYYFGRERLVAELIARFVGGTFLGLVGDSGSGKSSALRAGLLPALAGGVLPGSDAWPQAILRPGEHPLAELERALARALPDRTLPGDDASAALDAALAGLAPGQRLVLVVDQFEEVFNATRDDAERSAFIDLLTGERPGLKVIVSLRADYYGRCAAYPALARLLGSDVVLVGPLTSAELAAVIEHPAQRVGLRVEPALTEALVADAGSEPGVLPLLSTCLLELWGVREGGRLTLAAYRASGGLQGAIARLAEATFADLDPHRQSVARALLLRLAGPGEGAELVRRRVPLSELDADRDPAVAEVLETLTDARLLTMGEGHVEVAHEALLREWPRLRGWLEEDAAGRAVRLHLIGAVHDWEQRGREPGDLYRGARLATALDWAAEHGVELNAAERAFLDESRQASEQEVERQRRTNRILRGLLAGAAVLLLVAAGAGGFAALQGQRAADEARQADEQRTVAEQRRLEAEQSALDARSRELIASAVAARDQDPLLAKLLAVEAVDLVKTPTYESSSMLHQVLAADPIIARYSWPDPNQGELSTDLDPSGQLLVASGGGAYPTNHLEVADARTGIVQWFYPPTGTSAAVGGGFIGPSWFSVDGKQVIAGLYWGEDRVAPPSGIALGAAIWDAQTGALQQTIDLGPCGGQVTAVAENRLLVWTPWPGRDGRTGCHWLDDYKVEAVDLATDRVTVLSDHGRWEGGGHLSGDGRFAAFEEVSEAGTTASVVIELATGKRVFRLPFDEDSAAYANAGGLNHDGTLLLYVSSRRGDAPPADRPTRVYEIARGTAAEPVAQLPGLDGEVLFAKFDPTGTTWYQTSRDGTLRTWDPSTGELLSTWPAVGSGRPSIAADGRTVLVSLFASPTAVLLDTGAKGEIGHVQTCHGFIPAGSLHVRDGLAAFLEDCSGVGDGGRGVMQVIDVQDRTLQTRSGWWAQDLAISPDGGSLVSQQAKAPGLLGPLMVAALGSGSPVVELKDLCWYVRTSPSTPADHPNSCAVYPHRPLPFTESAVQWSPDGTMIAAVGGYGPVDLISSHLVVWDAHSGDVLFKLLTDQDVFQVIFTPDSKRLVVSFVGTRRLDTLSTETGAIVTTTMLDPSVPGLGNLRFIGFTPDGSTILAVADPVEVQKIGGPVRTGNATLLWLDAATLQIKKTVANAHTGSPKSMAQSPDGSLMATGASDGILRVWDTTTGALEQQMDFGGSQVEGVAFIDDRHLAVTPQGRGLLIMTIDPAELVETVRASLTRTFTPTECTTYGIDPCPTLAELQHP